MLVCAFSLTLRSLSSSGADASKLYHGRSSLQIACFNGFIKIVHAILRSEKNRLLIDICEGEPDGRTALHLACIEGHPEVVDALLGYTANPEKRDRSGQTALILALEYHQPQCVKVLIESGKCNLNTMSAQQMTPLHVASRLGNAEVVAVLLKRGVNVNMVDEQGRTAQDIAEGLKFDDIAQMLVRQRQILAMQQERSLTNAMDLIARITPARDGSSASSSNVNLSHHAYDSDVEAAEEDSVSRISGSQVPTVIAELKAKQKEDALSHQAEVHELKAYINLLENNNKVLERSLTAANNKLARSGEEVSPIDIYKIDRLNAEINQLQTERDELLGERDRAAALEQELALLRSKLSEDGANISSASEELRLTRELEAAQKEAAAAKAQVLAMKKMMQESVLIEAELKSCQGLLAQANKKNSTLEDDFAVAKENLTSMRKELSEAQHKLKAQTAADLPAKIKLLEAQLEQERAQHKEVKHQVCWLCLLETFLSLCSWPLRMSE